MRMYIYFYQGVAVALQYSYTDELQFLINLHMSNETCSYLV